MLAACMLIRTVFSLLHLCYSRKTHFSSGYNCWRDPMKPTQILQKLCKDNKLETPHYFQDHVVIGKLCMTFTDEEVLAWNGPLTCKNRDEHLALGVLHRWQEIPKVGCKVRRTISIKLN